MRAPARPGSRAPVRRLRQALVARGMPRPATLLASFLAFGGCAGEAGPRTASTGPVAPGFTADTATRAGLASGAKASEAACRALPDGLWVRTRDGWRGECLRYAAAGAVRGGGAGPRRLAVLHIPGDASGVAYRFAGGAPQVEGAGEGYEVPAAIRRVAAEALSEAAGGRPVFLIGRPGMHGSSGDHARDRHTAAEVELVDAALTELRRRYGVRAFVLSGFSSGGAIAANLLARRTDIACAVLASAPLDLAAFYRGADGALPDHYLMRAALLADPMRSVDSIEPGGGGATTIVVLGDRRDRKVPAASWQAWTDAARRAGLDVRAAEASGFDPAEGGGAASFHRTSGAGLEAALACANGEPVPAPPRLATAEAPGGSAASRGIE